MAQRKLQQEIDRVFKRVAEGVQAFDAVYDKVMMTTNQSQKEKLEQDLKREIKKLQRLRDQIKTWMGSNDIKDKKSLADQRKLIETRFKTCEKEMKTKAYSKEGLTASLRLDPKEKEKREVGQFITSMIDDLDRQIETLDAEVEALQATAKRGKRDASKTERIADTERTIERHKWHQGKLEVILRLLENGNLMTDQVQSIQDDIRYYVEQNQDADFAEDDEIYDGLNLDEEEEVLGMNENDHLSSQDAQSIQDEPEPPKKPETVRKVSIKSPVIPHSTPAVAHPAVVHPSVTPMKPAPAPPRPADGLKYASAAAAAAAAAAAPGLAPLPPPPTPLSSAATSASAVPTTTTSTASAKATAPPVSSKPDATDATDSPVLEKPEKPKTDRADKAEKDTTDRDTVEVDRIGKTDKAEKEKADVAQETNGTNFHLPTGVQDLISCFEAAKNRIEHPPPLSAIMSFLDASSAHCPDASDADKPRHYHPSTPFPTSTHFPQEPLPMLHDLTEKLDDDTLFYVFYYRQGTYAQYLAAKELKKHSWRFHKKFLTWFQRHEEPSIITDDYEQGTYRYFDFERRKAHFEFEYQYLEDEI